MDERIKAVQKMQSYIEEHILEEIKIDDLAKLTMYSSVHVRRLFLEWTKLSPSDYIRRLKLSKAALMLRDESCRVIDVVIQFGFGSVDGFQRAFKKEFGYNPKEYETNPVPIYLFTPYMVHSQKDVEKVISEYDFHGNGYIKDENNPRIQPEPICTRGYIELVPVISRDIST
ncbi:MAG: helix-turn-helix transcriptional regulator [Clostridiaceae bacterium]|jgi:AraC-like DNA-binding protein|nr:helix-turn-helix transcriptional regulator [Clostridiaceae bacterium]